MNNKTRRQFLKTSAVAAAGTFLIPSFLKAFSGQEMLQEGEKILVVLQLSGGNDGLNTCIPFGDDAYYRLRPNLGLRASEILKADHYLGFHPSMDGIHKLFKDGEATVIQNVGYPNPDRSHFRSMDIWHAGSSASDYWQTGWLGRYLDASCADNGSASRAIELGGGLSLALKGNECKGLAMDDPKRLYQAVQEPFNRALVDHHSDHPQVSYLYKTLAETTASAEYIFEKAGIVNTRTEFPGNPLSQSFGKVAAMIRAGLPTRVYYLELPGFDTHVNQKGQQQRLLGMFSEAMGAFAAEMKSQGRWKDVTVMAFSEFGRRVGENASGGTDHGTANVLFLFGGALKKPGFHGNHPNLTDLDEGDLKYQTDFREIYADLLTHWLGVDHEPILGQKFKCPGWV
ncbi:MAG: DUF1501 domain-containing protein [Bacteroidia bacterium]|nr:DUF1501 domain-containing protein [Bacteroidia bacterium]